MVGVFFLFFFNFLFLQYDQGFFFIRPQFCNIKKLANYFQKSEKLVKIKLG